MSDPSRSDPPAVLVTGASAGYGGRAVLHDLSLRIDTGELVGLVGPSGAGKTTLLRLLTGRADLLAGQVEVLGHRPSRRRPPPQVGYVPQLDQVDWDFPLTVEQVVLLGEGSWGARRPWFSRRERAAARAVLERLGMGALAARSIRALSGGQRQRMFLARALLHDRRLLLLDEPTSGVDVATRREVLGVLDELRAEGRAVVLTTHDLNQVAALLPRVVCLSDTVTADGRPTDVLTPAVLERTYGAPMRVLRDGNRIVVVDQLSPIAPAPDLADLDRVLAR